MLTLKTKPSKRYGIARPLAAVENLERGGASCLIWVAPFSKAKRHL
jgi:hypothetical protein